MAGNLIDALPVAGDEGAVRAAATEGAAVPAGAEVGELQRQVAELTRRVKDSFVGSAAVQILIDSETGLILDANPAALSYYGYSQDEFKRLRVMDLNQLPEELVARELSAARTKRRSYFEFKHRLASGEVRDVQVYAGPVLHGGREAVHSIICDITERTELANQLAHSQRMDALGRMAGGVAHDLNNLLTAFDMLTALIRVDLTQGRSVEGHLLELEALTGRGSALTQQLLAFCRRQQLSPRLLDLNQVVAGMHGLLSRLMRRDVRLSFQLSETPLSVVADATRLEQVLLNLVLNARDAMSRGGVVSVETAEVVLTDAQRAELDAPWQSAVRLSVRDQGVGMDEETLSHLFEPFFTTKGPGEGTGLGLSTVYGIVEQSGGRIRVESQLDVGSAFFLWLPKAEEVPVLAEPSAPLLGARGGNEQVLLVDDDADVRLTLREVLAQAGYQVIEADGGEAAIARYREAQGEVALLITDVVMPGMSGPELVERLRQQAPKLRVLYTSGYLDHPNVGLGLKGAGDTLLQKPFSAASLLNKVRQIIDNQSA